MSALSRKLRCLQTDRDRSLAFFCPGCEEHHTIRIDGIHAWQWDNNLLLPTFHPSILVTSGHYSPEWNGGDCWCTYRQQYPEKPSIFVCRRCHSFVKRGKIQFLLDSTHSLAGLTVVLPDLPDQPQNPERGP